MFASMRELCYNALVSRHLQLNIQENYRQSATAANTRVDFVKTDCWKLSARSSKICPRQSRMSDGGRRMPHWGFTIYRKAYTGITKNEWQAFEYAFTHC